MSGNRVCRVFDGEVLTLRPAKPRSLLAVLKSLAPLNESLSRARDRAPGRFEF